MNHTLNTAFSTVYGLPSIPEFSQSRATLFSPGIERGPNTMSSALNGRSLSND